MSGQLTFTIACAVVLSAVVPGTLGYLSARLEVLQSAERNLHALETRLQARELRDARPVSFPAPCAPGRSRRPEPPVTALVPEPDVAPPGRSGHHASTPAWLPELLRALQETDAPG
ncbi:hypothetical protein [Nonomuraea rhizosphaerae]|uniref:hypothetical protein n=1 Tax=Nonomuraea rhizosphaerae TaxID=2665663 RepID=UPI001C5D6FC7|nr:hypothetical protein [Nonomuraea rhizosphaerae]